MPSKKLIQEKKGHSICTFNFSTLYAKINENKLKFVFLELINFALREAQETILLLQNSKQDGLVIRKSTVLYLTKLN